jgi:hypothetical protein
MSLCFCYSKNQFIRDILKNHLGLTNDKLEIIYNHIFNQNNSQEHKPIIIDKSDVYLNELTDIEHYLLTGIDLPIITSSKANSNKKLMVIGSEPLRNWNYFIDHELSIYDHIAISTPYSLHQQDAKETLYYKIIEHLSKTHKIYLTDLRKIWFAGFERHKTFLEAELHNEFLLDEINYFNPECIITFGKNVYDALQSILKTKNLDIKVHYLIHPSQRTQGEGRKTFFEKVGIDISKYKYITNASERNVMPYLEYLDKIISP